MPIVRPRLWPTSIWQTIQVNTRTIVLFVSHEQHGLGPASSVFDLDTLQLLNEVANRKYKRCEHLVFSHFKNDLAEKFQADRQRCRLVLVEQAFRSNRLHNLKQVVVIVGAELQTRLILVLRGRAPSVSIVIL
jgi:hypothetical protein